MLKVYHVFAADADAHPNFDRLNGSDYNDARATFNVQTIMNDHQMRHQSTPLSLKSCSRVIPTPNYVRSPCYPSLIFESGGHGPSTKLQVEHDCNIRHSALGFILQLPMGHSRFEMVASSFSSLSPSPFGFKYIASVSANHDKASEITNMLSLVI